MKKKRLPYLQKLSYLGSSGGSSNEDDVVNVSIVHLGIADGFLDRFHRGAEQIGVQLLETGTGDGCVEIDTFNGNEVERLVYN